MEGNEDDLRTALEGAFDAETEDHPATPPEPVPAAAEVAAQPDAAAPADEEADRGDGRTRSGQFARKAADGTALAPAAPETVAAPTDPYARAPQSWKPGAREAWASLPAPVREEVHRRERENARVVQESAQSRQLHEYVAQLGQQFAPALQAEGVDVMTATANLMNLASRLRYGHPTEKAYLAATIVRNYGVDVNALADALDRLPQGAGQAQQPQMLQDPRVDQLLAQLTQAQAQRQQRLADTAINEVEGFGGDKEFFEDVRDEMADLLEVAARRGVDMTLAQAYERACSLHPEISRVMTARSQATAAGNSKQSTQRARHAASSVRGTPSGVSTPPATDLRSEIEAAIEQVGGR